MVEIAMSVLRAPPSDNAELKGVRVWATTVINRHSGTRLEDNTERALQNNKLPYVVSGHVEFGPPSQGTGYLAK
jgi:hypothetical protein